MGNDIRVVGPEHPAISEVLTDGALTFLADLHNRFNSQRKSLLGERTERQRDIEAGNLPGFLDETAAIRSDDWRVAPAPDDLQDRRVEITGPVDRKMVINALNSSARVFMADFEDANSPTWSNVLEGQVNLRDANRRTIRFDNPDGRVYELGESPATLVVRPRGWHLDERHVEVGGEPISASLFDFGLYMFHNAAELLTRGSGPYFYLPKLESHQEARLWNDVFVAAQEALGIPNGSIRATVLIETITAAFEMDEILYEIRDHASGLNAGRWDYIFSMIKKLRNDPEAILPDRAQVTMAVPFMRSYAQLMVRTCHRRGAHAIGGMAAFIPNRRDPEVTAMALDRVREDKEREAGDGFDGTWIAHPDLAPVALEVFDRVLGDRPHQKDKLREDVSVAATDLLETDINGAAVTEEGVRLNVSVALQYIDAWLNGNGAAAINNLMEDAATAEISRAQLWQWRRHGTKLDDGRTMTAELYRQVRDEELEELGGGSTRRLADAVEVLDALVLSDEFEDFLTLRAYDYLR